MTETLQLENNDPKWQLSKAQLTCECGPQHGLMDEDIEEIIDPPQWFRCNMPNMGDSPQETKEIREATIEQIREGIIKVRPQNKPQMINPNQGMFGGPTNVQAQQFMQMLKHDPSKPELQQTMTKNTFRPKIKDTRTGKARKIGPNDKCPCGTGKKFKKCHGRGKF